MAPTWRYKALILLSYSLGNVLCASALKQLDGKSNQMFPKSNRTVKSSVGSSCTSYYSCDTDLYCYDGWFSDTCTSCTDSSYPCDSSNSIDGLCCPGSSSGSSSVGSSCTSYYSCDTDLYCYDGWFSDTCTSCTDSSYPCDSSNSIDGLCCPGSSSPSPSGPSSSSPSGPSSSSPSGPSSSSPSGPSSSSPSGPSSSNDFSWATTALASLYPGVIFSIDDGCGWTIAGGMEPYEGNCADLVFLENESDRWCTISFSGWGDSGSVDVCLANSEADCCKVAPGPTAGIAIALILLLAGIIACICRCCLCCCFKSKSEAPQVIVVQAPAATASEKIIA